jgi:ribosomal-protein-alanine N-acetyltransferase
MAAVLRPSEARFAPMAEAPLDAVLAVEAAAYSHPWTRGNFRDSLTAGYQAQVLEGGDGADAELLGYFVAMAGVGEVHLLNLTVAPAHQGCGWGRAMLEALAVWSRGQQAQWLWLEVRPSNPRAIAVYETAGFRRVGLRKRYYPAAAGEREDAIVMSLKL